MVETIQWTDAGVVMIDQTRLPREEVFVTCRDYQEVAEAIRTMVIRGAPAIGVAAAMGVALGVLHADPANLDSDFETICDTLARNAAHGCEPVLGDRPDEEALCRIARRAGRADPRPAGR